MSDSTSSQDAADSWLLQAPEENLLETDISSGSYNVAPWEAKERDERREKLEKSQRLILNGASEDHDDAASLAFLQGLSISDTAPLGKACARSTCLQCHRSRKFYCYSCRCPLSETRALIPVVPSIPIPIDVIKHKHEPDSKSTAVHAAILCPSQVRIWTYPEAPFEQYEQEKVLFVFPGPGALSLEKAFWPSTSEELIQPQPYDRILFIDGNWQQVRQIANDPRLQKMPRLMLTGRDTLFWRNQAGKPKEYLGTIEAIYYLCRDYHEKVWRKEYGGEYDNLLFLFKFMYDRLHRIYET